MESGSEVSVARVVAKTRPPTLSRTQSCRDPAFSVVCMADVRRRAKSTGSGVEEELARRTESVLVLGGGRVPCKSTGKLSALAGSGRTGGEGEET